MVQFQFVYWILIYENEEDVKNVLKKMKETNEKNKADNKAIEETLKEMKITNN